MAQVAQGRAERLQNAASRIRHPAPTDLRASRSRYIRWKIVQSAPGRRRGWRCFACFPMSSLRYPFMSAGCGPVLGRVPKLRSNPGARVAPETCSSMLRHVTASSAIHTSASCMRWETFPSSRCASVRNCGRPSWTKDKAAQTPKLKLKHYAVPAPSPAFMLADDPRRIRRMQLAERGPLEIG